MSRIFVYELCLVNVQYFTAYSNHKSTYECILIYNTSCVRFSFIFIYQHPDEDAAQEALKWMRDTLLNTQNDLCLIITISYCVYTVLINAKYRNKLILLSKNTRIHRIKFRNDGPVDFFMLHFCTINSNSNSNSNRGDVGN